MNLWKEKKYNKWVFHNDINKYVWNLTYICLEIQTIVILSHRLIIMPCYPWVLTSSAMLFVTIL